jgi:hypothetical protein
MSSTLASGGNATRFFWLIGNREIGANAVSFFHACKPQVKKLRDSRSRLRVHACSRTVDAHKLADFVVNKIGLMKKCQRWAPIPGVNLNILALIGEQDEGHNFLCLLKLLLRIQQNRHRTFIHQLDLHHLLKPASLAPQSRGANLLHEQFIQPPRHLRRRRRI